MAVGDAGDLRLIKECNAFHDAFAGYVRDCAVLAEVEATGVELPETEEVRRWTSMQWQEALCRVSRVPADTPPGVLAKGGVLRGYLAERPADDPYGTELISSILADLEHLLG